MPGEGGGVPLGSLWGPVQASVTLKETTAQLWGRIRQALDLPPQGATGVTFDQVNYLRATAAGIRNAQDSFTRGLNLEDRTGYPQGLTARDIASAPWSRPPEEQAAAPRYQVNFEMTLTDQAGQTTTSWFTTYVRGEIPGTYGEVQDLVEEDAEYMAIRYGSEFGGVGGVQVLRI